MSSAERQDASSKVERIIDYLAGVQDSEGAFPAVRHFYGPVDGGTTPSEFPGWYFFGKCPFFAATILFHLKGISTPEVALIRRRGTDFLAGTFEGALVRYVPAKYQDVWFPTDVDDTCLVRKVLLDNGRRPPGDDEMVLRNRDPHGRFYTWLVPRWRHLGRPADFAWLLRDKKLWMGRLREQNEANATRLLNEYRDTQEPAVDANVLLYFGDDPRVRGLGRLIVEALRSPRIRLEYYDSLMGAYFHTARTYDAGAAALAELRDDIVEYITSRQDEAGQVQNGLDTAMAALTLIYMNCWGQPLRRAIRFLLNDPMHQHGWEPLPYVNPVNRAFSDGSAALTAAFYCDALQRFANYDGDWE